MSTIAFALFLLLVILTTLQAAFGIGFCKVLRHRRPAAPADHRWPRASVILCLRGADPFLGDTLRALLDLDYPNHDVRIVIDSEHDPAHAVVHGVLAEHERGNLGDRGQVTIEVLQRPRETCGLKCSSLLQAISHLPEDCEVVALLDADTIPHRSWLRELVAPLADPNIAVAAGNRWYMPDVPSWGALVRYLWNAAAVAQMYWSHFTWGGSLAIRTQVLHQSDLLQRWGRAFCEDTTIYDSVRSQGLRVAFVPTVMMVNRESCSLAEFFPWMRRQLLNGRLYHSTWPALATHGVISTCALAAAVMLLIAAVIVADWQAVAWLGSGLLLLQLSSGLLLALTEWSVRKIVRARAEPVHWLRPATAAKLVFALPLTQFLYAAALLMLGNMRRVQWRGVQYDIATPWDVKLVAYEPYRASPAAAGTAPVETASVH